VDVPRTTNKQQDIFDVTATIIQQFEAWIRETPEQWLWCNARWVDEENKRRRRQTTITSDTHLVSPPAAFSTASSLES